MFSRKNLPFVISGLRKQGVVEFRANPSWDGLFKIWSCIPAHLDTFRLLYNALGLPL